MLTTLRLGTDCSGAEIPMIALRNLSAAGNLQREVELSFTSDVVAECQKFASDNFQPLQSLGDMTTRDHTQLRDCDVYAVGFPCQPFSGMGRKRGFSDANRGLIIKSVVDTIAAKQPRLFILENVVGILSASKPKKPAKAGKTAKKTKKTGPAPITTIMKMLRECGRYVVEYRKLDTKDHGVPHSRPRVYIIGQLRTCPGEIRWPEPIESTLKVSDLLDDDMGIRFDNKLIRSSTVWNNITFKEWEVRTVKHEDPDEVCYVIDVDKVHNRASCMREVSPCLMYSHPDGHYATTRRRRFKTEEQCRLQGICPNTVRLTFKRRKFGEMLGNAMSVNVVERLLVYNLKEAGLVNCALIDRWANGDAARALMASVNKTFL